MARNSLTRYGGGYEWDPFMSLHREMNRLFDDAYRGTAPAVRGRLAGQGGEMIKARINVSETDKELRVSAELPGVKQEDINVSLDDEVLTIRGEKKVEETSDKENYHFMERSYGSFQRSLRLPFAVQADQVHADFKDGVLTVTLPKSPQQDRSRKIEIGGQKPISQQPH